MKYSERKNSQCIFPFRNFTKFTGKHLCQSLFFNKVACLKPATVLKKRLWHRRFPVNFPKFLKRLFLHRTHLEAAFELLKSSLSFLAKFLAVLCSSYCAVYVISLHKKTIVLEIFSLHFNL